MTQVLHTLRVRGNGRPAATSTGGVVTRRIAHSSATALAVYVAGAGLSYCSQMVLARLVGAASFGIYSYVLAWVTILAYFSALGFDVSLLRLVSVYRTREAWSLVRGVIRYAEWLVMLGAMAVVLGGGVVVLVFQTHHTAEQAASFLIGFLLVPVWALLWIRSSIVRAFGGVASALAPDRLVRDGLLLVLVTLASQVFGLAMDAPRAMVLTLMSSATGLCLVSIAAHRKTASVLRGRVADYSESAAWRRAALPLVMLAVGEVALNRTGVVLLGWAGETTNAGMFALVCNMAVVVALPRIAVNALFAPMVADLFAHDDHVALRQMIAKTSWWTLLGASAIALPLAAIPEHLLGLFGEVFETGAGALRIVLFAQVVAGACGSQLYLMTMTGHERPAAALLAVSLAIGAVTSFVLINFMAVDGAAIAAAIAVILWNALMAWFIWRRLRLLPGVLVMLHTTAV
jgi:O-antigen/teichoic acid export membrane protein